MLWPEKRKGNMEYKTASGKMLPGWIDLTYETSYLRVPKGYLPDFFQPLVGLLSHGSFFNEEGLELGPIPKGTPINLLSNIDLDKREGLLANLEHKRQIAELLIKIKKDLKALPKNATDEEARKVFANLVNPLLAASKCPDFIVNRGHYFGTDYFKEEPGLGDDDKRALIAFLKTL
jgi:hypothetical protein